jgi:hypothetical protein
MVIFLVRVAREHPPDWELDRLSFALFGFLMPGSYLTQHVLPYPYLVMSCPGCEPAHKDLVVVVVSVVLNVAFWTTIIFVGIVLFRFTRRLFSTRII